ncbi:MAG: 30S ribosome-binding factor RbfA [Saprospiraceae bacterium]
MDSKRQKQVAELIKRNFSEVLRQEGTYIYQNALVTVTHVQITPDLTFAKIYLSIYNTEHKQEVLLNLAENYHRLKHSLAHRIRKLVRVIPNYQLFEDDTLDEMFKINAMFDKLEADNQMGKDRSEEE